MKKPIYGLTMDELLTVVKSEVLQLDSWGREKLTVVVKKSVGYEDGKEYINAEVVRESKK